MGLNDNLRRINAYWVTKKRFMAGSYPGDPGNPTFILDSVYALIQAGITHFFDLTQETEAVFSPYPGVLRDAAHNTGRNLTYQRLAIADMSVPSFPEMRRILDTLDTTLDGGENIYLHCFGGRGRTGTVVGCYLVRHGMNGGNSLDKINHLRRGLPNSRHNSPETYEQRTYVLNWGLLDEP